LAWTTSSGWSSRTSADDRRLLTVSGIGALGYLAAFVGPLLLAWWLTPLALRLALRFNVFDVPDDRKAQVVPVPYLGGLAIVVAFSISILAAALVRGPGSYVTTLAILLGTGVVLAVTGLIDDFRGLGVLPRLVVEVSAGIVVVLTHSGATITGSAPLDAVATVLWVVLVVNAVNLLDNMDGLSAGVAAIASGAFFALAVISGQFLVAALSAALAGCSVGFLRHNFHPAKIYMGDAGSLFLGFLLAVCATRLDLSGTSPTVAFFVPVLVLGVAIFDTTLVVIERLRHGRTPFQGGRDHTSHRLVAVGLSVPVSVGLIYATALALAWFALLLSQLSTGPGLMLVGFIFTAGTALLILLQLVPVYDNSRRSRETLRLVRGHAAVINSPAPDAGKSGSTRRTAAE
jgi:UDP-GlcNAc:undecaprenyl-phosphate/decaprenyl-phosphate GlcNAc-1-phosphate transferase